MSNSASDESRVVREESWVQLARTIAQRAHHGQFRRDGATPYVQHPEAVARRVAGDRLAEAVAWLHDVLEDTATTEADLLAAGLPAEVVDAVSRLTKREPLDYEAYLLAVRENALARKVKIADMLANLADHPTDRQIVKYAKGLLALVPAEPLAK